MRSRLTRDWAMAFIIAGSMMGVILFGAAAMIGLVYLVIDIVKGLS